VWVERTNTGAAYNKDGRLVRFGQPGRPDITGILFRPSLGIGQALYIEVKKPGCALSAVQATYQQVVVRHGGLHYKWWSEEQAHEWLDNLPD
jgi:hypothetical protein